MLLQNVSCPAGAAEPWLLRRVLCERARQCPHMHMKCCIQPASALTCYGKSAALAQYCAHGTMLTSSCVCSQPPAGSPLNDPAANFWLPSCRGPGAVVG